MTHRLLPLLRSAAVLLLACATAPAIPAQTTAQMQARPGADLEFVVYFSRHGIRSPTGKTAQYNQFSAAAWPEWNVTPGYLTPHGFEVIKRMGSFERTLLAGQHLFVATGCADVAHVTFYADSAQRTRESGRALAAGMFPGCDVPVGGLPEGSPDALFHATSSGVSASDAALASAAIAGRTGGDPAAVVDAYRPQLEALDRILSTCGTATTGNDNARTSLLAIPSALTAGAGDHAAEMHGPLNTAATLAENVLLEYTQGMDPANVAWGCVDGTRLRSLIDLHTAASDLAQRTPAIARIQASNLLDHIDRALRQAATNRPVPGALGKPGDRALFLIGHDTNLSNMSGLLNLTWIADGRRDDTPPGSTLVFELWRDRRTRQHRVRVYYSTQTLEQMRNATELDPAHPPARVPVFLPGCSEADMSCPLDAFSTELHRVIDPRFIKP